MIVRKTFFIFSIIFFSYFVESLNSTESKSERDVLQFIIAENFAQNKPPKPNYTLTLTAKPDPFETEDPTTKAKLTLRRDLFSSENGEIVFYALLVAFKEYCELPTNGIWDGQNWPKIPNYSHYNASYQVTPPKWNPFENSSLTQISYTLGDGSCDGDKYYCNVPLREDTKYALKIRAFTNSGYQDTDIICFETLDKLPLTEIVSLLGGCLLLTAAAVSLTIFDFGWIKRIRIVPGLKAKNSSPVPEALSHKSFLKYSQQLLNTPGRLNNEFHLLGTLSSDVSTLCLHAQRVGNRYKNRYGNILPFDMTRVKLSVIEDDPSSDYINASFIKGSKQEVHYIASQGPKEETCHDFYRMIIEQNIELIVMLTDLSENGVEKCFKYYPDEDEIMTFKEIKVSRLRQTNYTKVKFNTRSEMGSRRRDEASLVVDVMYSIRPRHFTPEHATALGICCTRERIDWWCALGITCKQKEDLNMFTKRVLSISTNGRKLLVTQLHFKNWWDFESPADPKIMLEFCELVNKQTSKGCILVHCSAGSGRTGTFIAIDILLQELKTSSKISVFNTVLKLRQQRINMVQTEAQLGYIYKCVSYAIEKSFLRIKEM